MKRICVIVPLLVLGLVLPSCPANAQTQTHSGLSYSTTAVKTGVWSSKFSKCKAYAIKHGRPLIVLWANNGCPHCNDVCNSLGRSAGFKSWMSSSGAVFVFGLGTSGGENLAIKNFAYDKSKQFPYLAVYLKQKGATSVSKYATFTGTGMNATGILSKIKHYLRSYVRIKLKAGSGGSVSQVGYRKIGKTTTLVATAKSGYKFKGWYNSSGVRVSTKPSYRLKVTKADTFTAQFVKK